MGMSASQARYLNLVAQQSDLEFQGQQINESRTTLSEQTNNLYTQLQNLSVPTPPHTSDYTEIQYSGSLGADSFTIGNIVPSGSTYSLNLEFKKAGNSTYSVGKGEVKAVPEKIKLSPTTNNTGISLGEISKYYIQEGDAVRHATTEDFNYDKNSKTYSQKEGITYLIIDGNGTEYANPDYAEGIGKSLNGNPLMYCQDTSGTKTGLDKYLTKDEKKSAIEALRNGFPEYSDKTDGDLLDLFYVSFSREGTLNVPHFTLKTDVSTQTSQWVEYHDITATGKYTVTEKHDNCQLTFDTNGRITQISIPVTKDDGSVVYHSINVEAKTVTDEKAYDDAYNKYEYSKYEYDQEQLKINAQMSVIQSQDKKLELKLQRLDNERTQITTELEALKKVVGDNIEKTYKTFSG